MDGWQSTGPVEDVLPLLPLQEGMYFHGASVRCRGSRHLRRAADRRAVRDRSTRTRCAPAVDAVMRRHQALRAGFRELRDGRIVQVIWADVPVASRS